MLQGLLLLAKKISSSRGELAVQGLRTKCLQCVVWEPGDDVVDQARYLFSPDFELPALVLGIWIQAQCPTQQAMVVVQQSQ